MMLRLLDFRLPISAMLLLWALLLCGGCAAQPKSDEPSGPPFSEFLRLLESPDSDLSLVYEYLWNDRMVVTLARVAQDFPVHRDHLLDFLEDKMRSPACRDRMQAARVAAAVRNDIGVLEKQAEKETRGAIYPWLDPDKVQVHVSAIFEVKCFTTKTTRRMGQDGPDETEESICCNGSIVVVVRGHASDPVLERRIRIWIVSNLEITDKDISIDWIDK